MGVAVVAALVAAACFAAGSALQHRSATTTPTFDGFGARSLARFVWQTLRHPAWLAGSLADIVGLAFQGLALHEGPLTLVQPVIVTGLVFALPLRQWLDRRRPARREMLDAAVLTAGLIVFLVAAAPKSGREAVADHVPAVIAVIVIAVVIVGCASAGRALHGTWAAAILGLGAGVAFAGTAAALKATTDVFPHGLGAVVTSWPLYGLIAAGAAGLLLSQLAFQAGPLRASLPAMNTVDPVVSLIIGLAVYHEQLRGGVPAVSAAVVGVVVVLVAAVALSCSEAVAPAPSAGGTTPTAAG